MTVSTSNRLLLICPGGGETHLGMKSTPASLMVAQLAARVSLATFCSSSAELLSAQYDSTAFLISRLPPCVRMCVYARLSVSL